MREPRFRGCGVFMPMQSLKNCIDGDTCFDADAGFLIYQKGEWISNNRKYAELYNKTLNTVEK